MRQVRQKASVKLEFSDGQEGVEILRGTIWRDVWHVAARRLRGTSWHVVARRGTSCPTLRGTSRHVVARCMLCVAPCGLAKNHKERSASRHFEQRENIFSMISPLFACVASLNAKRDIATQGPGATCHDVPRRDTKASWHVVARRGTSFPTRRGTKRLAEKRGHPIFPPLPA